MGRDESLHIPIPEERGLPLLGSVLSFSRDRLAFLLELSRSRGDICAFRLGPRRAVLLNSAEYVNKALAETGQGIAFQRPGAKTIFRVLFENGLGYREGASHRQHRKRLNPSFHARAVSVYAPMITAAAEEIMRGWADGAVIELYREMTNITLRALGETLFVSQDAKDILELHEASMAVLEHLSKEGKSLIRSPGWLRTPRRTRFRRQLADLHAVVGRMIDAARRSDRERPDLVSALLRITDENGEPLREEQIRDEIIGFFFAGHKTSAKLLCSIFYCLIQHPNASQTLRRELNEALKGRAPTLEDLKALTYTLQVIKEVLRLHPPLPLLARSTVQDTSFEPYLVPADSLLFVSPYTLHRNPRYFVKPTEFMPERFTPEMEGGLPRSAYIPFGDGPRVCIGASFAMLEAQLLVATIAQRATFDLMPGPHAEPDQLSVMSEPRQGIWVRVRRRDLAP